jgi:hypothetical protein
MLFVSNWPRKETAQERSIPLRQRLEYTPHLQPRGTHPFQVRRLVASVESPTLAQGGGGRRQEATARRRDTSTTSTATTTASRSTSTPPYPFSPKEIATRSWRRSGDAKWRRGGARSRSGGATQPRRRTPPFQPPPPPLPSPR